MHFLLQFKIFLTFTNGFIHKRYFRICICATTECMAIKWKATSFNKVTIADLTWFWYATVPQVMSFNSINSADQHTESQYWTGTSGPGKWLALPHSISALAKQLFLLVFSLQRVPRDSRSVPEPQKIENRCKCTRSRVFQAHTSNRSVKRCVVVWCQAIE